MSDTTDNTIIAPHCGLSSVDCLSSDKVVVAVDVDVEKKTVWGYLKKFFGFCSDKSVVDAVSLEHDCSMNKQHSLNVAVDCKPVVETCSETSATIVEEQQAESSFVVDSGVIVANSVNTFVVDSGVIVANSVNTFVADADAGADADADSVADADAGADAVADADADSVAVADADSDADAEIPEQTDEVKIEELVEVPVVVCEEASPVAASEEASVTSEELPSASALEPEPLPQKKRRKHRKSE